VNTLAAEKAAALADVRSGEADLAAVNAKLQGMVDNEKRTQQSANRAIATLKTRESEMESHTAEIEGVRMLLKRAEGETQKAVYRFKVATDEHKKLEEAKNSLISQLEGNLAETQAALQKRTSEKNALSQQCDNGANDLAAKQQECEMLEGKVQDAAGEIRKLTERKQATDERIQRLQHEVHALKDETSAQATELSAEMGLAKLSAQGHADLSETCSGLESELRTFKSEVVQAQDKIKHLKNDLIFAEEKREQLEGTVRLRAAFFRWVLGVGCFLY